MVQPGSIYSLAVFSWWVTAAAEQDLPGVSETPGGFCAG